MIYHGPRGLDDLEETVLLTCDRLKPQAHRFDSLVTTGLSGVVVGSPVALLLDKPLVILRKPSDDCHSSSRFINLKSLGKRYLVIDDLQDTGATLKRIRATLQHVASESTYVGVYFYGGLWATAPRQADGFKWAKRWR